MGILRAYRLDLRRNKGPGLRGTSQGNAVTGRSAREFVLTPRLDIRGRFRTVSLRGTIAKVTLGSATLLVLELAHIGWRIRNASLCRNYTNPARPLVIHLAKVDLTTSRLSFELTGPSSGGTRETVRQTTARYIRLSRRRRNRTPSWPTRQRSTWTAPIAHGSCPGPNAS